MAKGPRDYVNEATERELLDELAHRRRQALAHCTDEEIEEELVRRGVDRRDQPPKVVEK